MQHHSSLFPEPHSPVFPPYLAATNSIGTVSDPVPVHPDGKHPSFDEFKQKNKRKPHSDSLSEEPDGKHPDPDHQIDEYA
ncbi:MAG: hypothetical protein AUK53_06820 [Betaproteobacteria bacterium CG2_30_59_46]|nr:MAG: hypothetical protein AUK53_06820 [Betaproteobacteria bacterium CG2_30_59_46]PIQ12641.1 MAG: hypothetical protein COW70_08930 [Hydrogenophilales bacterium CG18_big_fil_WC_8_21_14_2_50_58_12]PIY00756.1 MAG: hypothetical protein COZ23_06680 [Hydrogenophilales bacterium CG_4_10_14_3_um_filter_58_23]